MTPGASSSSRRDGTSMDNNNSQLRLVTIRRLKEVIEQITANNVGLKVRINNIRVIKIKMLSIKRFNGIKIKHKGSKLPILSN